MLVDYQIISKGKVGKVKLVYIEGLIWNLSPPSHCILAADCKTSSRAGIVWVESRMQLPASVVVVVVVLRWYENERGAVWWSGCSFKLIARVLYCIVLSSLVLSCLVVSYLPTNREEGCWAEIRSRIQVRMFHCNAHLWIVFDYGGRQQVQIIQIQSNKQAEQWWIRQIIWRQPLLSLIYTRAYFIRISSQPTCWSSPNVWCSVQQWA